MMTITAAHSKDDRSIDNWLLTPSQPRWSYQDDFKDDADDDSCNHDDNDAASYAYDSDDDDDGETLQRRY